MDMKLAAAGAVLLLVGCLLGAFLFPTEVEVKVPYKVIETEVVTVPGPVQIIEKEIEVENTEKIEALNEELRLLQERYEQVTDERYYSDEAREEFNAIERAKSDFEADYLHLLLWRDYRLSEISIVKYRSEDANVREVRRWVDGVREDYDKVDVVFEVKAMYEDNDGVKYRYWNVEVSYDLDSEGREDVDITADLL